MRAVDRGEYVHNDNVLGRFSHATSLARINLLIVWRRSARGACLFLLAVLGCLQASAQQKPASPLDEFERRFAAANSAKEAGDLPAAAAASEKIVALGLREMGKLRLFEAAYPVAARFSRRSLEFEDVADSHGPRNQLRSRQLFAPIEREGKGRGHFPADDGGVR